jgi:P27 family predicted phage terminase small subunit
MVCEPSTPEPPDWLSERALEFWCRVVPPLGAAGVIAEVDQGVLAMMCEAHALSVEALLAVNRDGVLVRRHGEQREHPLLKVAYAAQNEVRRYARAFGFTSRSMS